ncbi:MAG: YegP family protein, partial [Bacteroidales bacterium]|nr:YegP family protein [Bacteroidales bacterium]
DKAKKYRFNLKASNGEIIASGEPCPDKKSALKGIASIQKNAAAAKIVDETGEVEAAKKPRGKPAVAKNPAKAVAKAAPKPRGRKPAAK